MLSLMRVELIPSHVEAWICTRDLRGTGFHGYIITRRLTTQICY